VGAIILGVLALAAGLPALLWTISAAGFGEAQTLPMSAAAGAAVAVGALVGALSSQVAPGVHPTVGAAAAAVAVLLVPPMIFAATVPLTVSDDTISRHSFTVGFRDVSGRAYPAYVCDSETEIVRRAHPDRVAWLLTLTPLGVVADAPELPASALATAPRGGLPWAQAQMRQARLGPAPFEGYCYQPTSLGTPEAVQERRFESGGANPWLVLTEIVVLAATLAVVSRRTRW
jgi:hypothetical protein